MSDAVRFKQLFDLIAVLSLAFQIAGTALIAVLSYVVSRAVRRRLMIYWAAGWTCYTASLVAIMFASRSGPAGPVILTFLYFFLEYAAVLLIFAACRYTATERPPTKASWLLLAPAAVVALALDLAPLLDHRYTFFWTFAIHAAILGIAWAACIVGLRPALERPDSGPGVRIVAVGLVLLALDYLQHLPVGLYLAANHLTPSPYYYTVFSVIDGMLEFVLGFGTVIVIVDKVRDDLEAAHARLKEAHDRTAEALHTDTLTEVLSRYSFAATFEASTERRTRRGTLVLVDLDGLKNVNDTFGHAAGDAAIRAVAAGIRSLIRQEDKVYRMGGDEFVVVLNDMPIEPARQRMLGLDEAVNRALEPGHGAAGTLTVSWGAAAFEHDVPIKDAISQADAAMYDCKARRKSNAVPGSGARSTR